MEPKFQSSFIPKGPAASTAGGGMSGRRVEGRGLFSFLAITIFTISILLATGVFGYKFYLKYSIDKMGSDLEQARVTLQPETIRELTRLSDRITSTKELISRHHVLTPLFEFLELSTPITVRFNNFRYSMTSQGLELTMKGEARGYAALALQADIFNKSQYLKDPIFSELNLNDRGNVDFSFKAVVSPDLISYDREVERIGAPVVLPTSESVATSTSSTSSPQTATSTQN